MASHKGSKIQMQDQPSTTLGRYRRTIALRKKAFLALESDASSTLQNAGFSVEIRAFIFLLIYSGLRFGFAPQLDSLGDYAGYVFDALTVIAGVIVGRKSLTKQISFSVRWSDEIPKSFLPAFILGAAAMAATVPLGLTIPFNVSGLEAILTLIVFGPILEEFVFRFALWSPLLDLGRRLQGEGKTLAAIGSTLLFAYAHLNVAWFLPAGPIRSFVIYQSIYVVGLGGFAAWRLIRTGSLTSSILAHVGFNLGFYLVTLFV